MNVIRYREWDWNLDRGEGEFGPNEELPSSHAEVFLDCRGLPYRVVVKNPSEIRSLDSDDEEEFVYDYFHDESGKLVEKRSLDESGHVVLIVRYEYEGEVRTAETGWAPDRNEPPKRVRCQS